MASSSGGGPDQYEPYMLRSDERWWCNQYELLLKHGYELRPRFRPGWVPSWAGTKKYPHLCEDGQANRHPETIDARRLSDGKRVKIKKLIKGSRELEIARTFSDGQLAKDPRNHCVPILDTFTDQNDRVEFMVMPLLIKFTEPQFSFVDEVVDFMRQTLKGLSFMHEQGVAHRDCSLLNIMMDGERLYPKGFHPSMPLLDAFGKLARPCSRRSVSRVSYYFTDFGISSHFDGTEKTRLVTGKEGQDQDVPELHRFEPYNPFPVDVFTLGNLFRNQFTAVFENLMFIEPLVDKMTQLEPRDRPTSEEALRLFNDLVRRQTPRSLRWVIIYCDASRFERLLWDSESVASEALFMIKSFLPSLRRKVDKTM